MNQSIILGPILLIWAITALVYFVAWRRDGRVPADDIGVVFLFVCLLYTTLPPFSWLAQGGVYSSIFSGRLLYLQPSTQDTLYLLTIAVAYTIGFAAIYVILHKWIPQPSLVRNVSINDAMLVGSLGLIVLSVAVGILFKLGTILGTAENYADQYRATAELPLVIRQVGKFFFNMALVAKLIFLVGILQRWPRRRSGLIVYAILIVFSVDVEGSRTALFTGLMSIAIGWHMLVRPIPLKSWIAMFSLAIILFLSLGYWRNVDSWDAFINLDLGDFSLGELDAIWANAVDILHKGSRDDLDIPISAYLGEFVTFIPSQLLPFEKLTLSDWYLDTYYLDYKLAGGGWVFGMISQAIVGGGVFEALIRGAVLGAISVWLIRWTRAAQTQWWRLPVYLYLLIFSYQIVRDTTFRLFGELIQSVLPIILIVGVIGLLSSKHSTVENAEKV